MAESRARESFFQSHEDLLRWRVEIDPSTAVPEGSAPVAEHLSMDGRGGAVLCVMWSYAGPVATDPTSGLKPYYDSPRRELWLGGFLLKRLKKPAENQEAVLKNFQDDAEKNDGLWPPRIDDPISGEPSGAIRRLHDTLNSLNASIAQQAAQSAAPYSIHFFTDGTGQGIRWRIVAVAANELSQASS